MCAIRAVLRHTLLTERTIRSFIYEPAVVHIPVGVQPAAPLDTRQTWNFQTVSKCTVRQVVSFVVTAFWLPVSADAQRRVPTPEIEDLLDEALTKGIVYQYLRINYEWICITRS